jgi:GTPase SAR1 family protein
MACVRAPQKKKGWLALGMERDGQLIGLNLAGQGLRDAHWAQIAAQNDLSHLEALNLRGNQLSQVAGLEKMTRLRHLDLSDNLLEHLELPNPSVLQHIFLEGNKALATPPPETLAQGRREILRYLRDLKEQGSSKLYEAKILVLGAGGSGKTTLRRKLIHGIRAAMPTDEESTHGLEVEDWPFPCPETERFMARVWDFGGQEIYHATHQFFLTQRSLYIVVTDERREDNDLSYWLQVIDLLGGDSPVILVQNENGDRRTDRGFADLKRHFPQIKEPHQLNLKSKSDAVKLAQLSEDVQTWVRRLENTGFDLPRSWANVRAELQRIQTGEQKPYISAERFFEICENEKLEEKDAERASRLLHDLGAILHFQDDPTLKKTVILDNNWATAGVYAVVDDRSIQDLQGPFTREQALSVWSDTSKKNYHPAYKRSADDLLQLMLKFEICHQLRDAPNTYLVPQLLPKKRPDAADAWESSGKLQLRYDYPSILPKGMCSRLLVRLHRYLSDYRSDAWRSGAILKKEKAALLLEENPVLRRLQLRATGPGAKELLTIVAAEIDTLNEGYEKSRKKGGEEEDFVKKGVPCNCAKCQQKTEPYFFDFKVLKNALSEGVPTMQCQLHPTENVPVVPLLEELFDHAERASLKEAPIPKEAISELLREGKLAEALALLPKHLDWGNNLNGEFQRLKQAYLDSILTATEFLEKQRPIQARFTDLLNQWQEKSPRG